MVDLHSAKRSHNSHDVLRIRTTHSGALPANCAMTKSLTLVKKKKRKGVCGYPGHKGTGLAWLPVGPECCVFDAFFLDRTIGDRGVWGYGSGVYAQTGMYPATAGTPSIPQPPRGIDCWRKGGGIPEMGNELV